MTKKRIINIRITCVAFLGLMLGILFCSAYLKNQLNTFAVVISLISLFLLVSGILVYARLTKEYNEKCEFRKDVSKVLSLSSWTFLISFIVGIVVIISPYLKIFAIKKFTAPVSVYGTVCDYVQESDTYTKFIINNCEIISEDETYKTDFKICVYTTKSSSVSLGSNIEFEGELKTYSLFKGAEANKIYQNIAYQVFVNFSDIVVTFKEPTLKDQIKNTTKDILNENLNQDNANIFYAILFGEKQGLSDDTKDMFSYAGISHILAVSGLHIGVLVSAIYFVLKKLKVNKYVRLGLLASILLFYSYLCSFTPSVCRASIMATLLCLCDILHIEYDSLSSLSIAGIIILLCNPISLFSISFQLSFLSIFAIIAIAPSITSMLRKIKLPNFLASSLAISIATNIAILPVCQNVFAKVSLLGVIANIFVLPIFSVTYILLFEIIVCSLILRFLGFLLVIPNLFLQLIKTIANYISSLGFGVFKVFFISYWSLTLIVLASITLHFLMTRKLIKSGICLALVAMIFSIFLSSSIPTQYNGFNFVFCSKYNSNSCYYIENDEVYLIGSNLKSSIILNELKNLKIREIDYIVAYDFQLNDIQNFKEICQDNYVKSIYLPNVFEYNEIKDEFENVQFFENDLKLGKMEFRTITYANQIIAVTMEREHLGKVLIPELKPTKSEAKYLMDYYNDADILYLNSQNTNIDIAKMNATQIVYNGGIISQDSEETNYDIYIYSYNC